MLAFDACFVWKLAPLADERNGFFIENLSRRLVRSHVLNVANLCLAYRSNSGRVCVMKPRFFYTHHPTLLNFKTYNILVMSQFFPPTDLYYHSLIIIHGDRLSQADKMVDDVNNFMWNTDAASLSIGVYRYGQRPDSLYTCSSILAFNPLK
jgi:hypothetical protein